jgi:hypothetical protein
MVNNGKNLYLVGGQSDNSLHNEVWEYNLGTDEYTLLDEGGLNSPSPGTNYN